METIESLDKFRAQANKASARAVNLKTELHDLSEERPTNWEKIPEVAARAFEAFESLTALKQRIAQQGG